MILGYHAVSDAWKSPLAVPVSRLRSQLALLKRRGYEGLTFTESERQRRLGTLPARTVVVTFDDGYASTLLAAPVLAELGFPGTVFVVTRCVESAGLLDWPGMEEWLRPDTRDELRSMTWDDASRLAAEGWEIGSHTVTHPLLTQVTDDRLRRELTDSREAIARRLGSCTSLAYPYGPADSRVATEARRAGYEVACMLTFAQVADEPWRRPRIGMGPEGPIRTMLRLSRIGRAARRSRAALAARAVRRRRGWLPDA